MGQFIDFKHVKEHARFEPVLARYGIELAGRGEERKALCPFHEETKPSFKVNLGKKAFNCFGCGEHGNVLDFVAKNRARPIPRNPQRQSEIPISEIPLDTELFPVPAYRRYSARKRDALPEFLPVFPRIQVEAS